MINEAIQMLECVDKQDYADAVRALSARVAELEAQLAEAARQEKIHEWLSDRGWRVCTEKEARHYDSIGRQVRVRFAAPVPAQPSASSAVRALDMLSTAALDHYTPYMICVPTEKWVEAMGIAGEEVAQPSAPVAQPNWCSLGVGCDEAGACYALANGQPEQCPVTKPDEPVAQPAPAVADDVARDAKRYWFLRNCVSYTETVNANRLDGLLEKIESLDGKAYAKAFDAAIDAAMLAASAPKPAGGEG